MSIQERIRVLRIIARLNIGGPAIQTITLTKDLDPTRFESILATGHCGPGEEEMTELLQQKQVFPVRIEGLGRSISMGDDLKAFYGLTKLIRQFKPHIVHTHTAKAGALGRAASALLRVPARVHTFHGHVFHGYFSSLKTKAAIYTERALALLADRIIAISDLQKKELCDAYHIAPPEKTRVVPLGFDLSQYLAVSRGEVPGTLRQELQAAPEDIIVGIIGRIAPIKNHALFIESFALALSQNPNLRAVIIGGGLEEDVARLHQLAAQLHISSRLHFLGYRSQLASLYADLDIVALSSDNEGTPVALIEALASGRTCVATQVGGVADVLGNGAFGVLVPPRDTAALSTALLKLSRDSIQRKTFQQAAPSSVESRYGMTRLLLDISSLYQELILS
jgi:glycosyltransferase involved in cell wall biosynthesis